MDVSVVLLLVIGSVAISALARRWQLPAPLVLVTVALGLSFLLHDEVVIPPEVILGLVLPPLLYSASLESSYLDFRSQLRAITRLGVGLVVVTAFVVAAVAVVVMPSMPFAEAIMLGAIVAPPDAVSAAAIARKLGLPRNVMTLLSGESLINDAASLTLYKVALAGIGASGIFIREGLETFGIAVIAGIGVGLIIGFIVHWVRSRLHDSTVEVVLGLIVPFAAFWLAESIHGSGVLSVVAAGLYLGYTSPRAGYATRLQEQPVWAAIDLILESVSFAFIGLQIKFVLADIVAANDSTATAFLLSGVVLVTIIVIRPIYIFATNWTDRVHFRRRSSRSSPRAPSAQAPSVKESVVVSWAGMRGVVTLAAAAAIPETLGGHPFPARSTIQLTAYAAAIGTLLIQGTTLPLLIRRLRLHANDEARDLQEESRVRRLISTAAAAVIDSKVDGWAPRIGQANAQNLADKVARAVQRQGEAAAEVLERGADVEAFSAHAQDASMGSPGAVPGAAFPLGKRGPEAPSGRISPTQAIMMSQLRRELINAQRAVLVEERDSGRLSENVMRRMLRELDLEEETLSASWVTRLPKSI